MPSKSMIPSMLTGLLLCTVLNAQNEAKVIQEFRNRVEQYSSVRNQQGVSSKQSSSANKLAQQKEEASEKGQQARPTARQGDIFTPEIAAYFKKQVQATLHGPGGEKVIASLRRAEPLPSVHLEVNAPYPQNLPLQSTPPTLLLNLPELPKGLQYRVVGSTLVLYDEITSLVVDLIPGAVT